MPGTMSFRVKNVEAIQAGFLTLPDRIQRAILRRAVAASGRTIRKHIKKKTPKSRQTKTRDLWSAKTAEVRAANEARHGKKNPLADSLKLKPSSKWAGGSAAAKKGIIGTVIGHDKRIARHAHLVNTGHKGFFWSKDWSGKYVSGNQYFNKAVKSAKDPAAEKFKENTKMRFEKEVTKHFKRLVEAVVDG